MRIFFLSCIFLSSILFAHDKTFNDDLISKKENSIFLEDEKSDYSTYKQPEYKPAFFKMLLILIALLALIFLTFWIFKRLMRMKIHQSNLTKNIKILERRAISPKSMLFLIEIEGKKVLISESNLEVRKIKEIE